MFERAVLSLQQHLARRTPLTMDQMSEKWRCMGFFWKFTRSGRISSSYVSLIVDVDPTHIDRAAGKWNTSFEELGMIMLLLHDVEVLNQPQLGATKPAFRVVVQSLGYEPTLQYRQQRDRLGLVLGQSVMGRHNGVGLDWGRYTSTHTPMAISTDGLEVATYIQASNGRLYGNEDKLSCYRRHPDFCDHGEFYDLMPKHVVMRNIVLAMKQCDAERTERFVTKWLKWVLQ